MQATDARPRRAKRLTLTDGGFAKCPVQQLRIAEAMPEFTLQAADRVQVLRGPGVLVRGGGEPAEGRLAQVRRA